MDPECPLCGEKALMHDYHGTDEHYVCAECGYVVESAGMVSFAFESTGDLKQFVSGTSDPSYSFNGPGYRFLMNYLELTAQLMKVPSEVEELAKQYFEKTYRHEKVRLKSIDHKEVLVVACVYISCRQHNSFYTLLEMARMTKRDMFELGRAYKMVVHLLDLTLEHAGLGALSRDLFTQCQLPFPVMTRAHRLLNIGEKFWLVSGRNPVGLLSAVAYISWKAEKPAERCKIGISPFCKEHNLFFAPMVKRRANEIENVLCHLATQLPWIKSKPNNEKLAYILPEILDYQNTLINNMLLKSQRARKDAENLQSSKGKTDSKKDTSYGEILPPIMKRPVKRKKAASPECTESTATNYESDDWESLDVDEYVLSEKEVEERKKFRSSDVFRNDSPDG